MTKKESSAISDARAIERQFWETVKRMADVHASLVSANISSRLGDTEWPPEANAVFRRLCEMVSGCPVFTKREINGLIVQSAIDALEAYGGSERDRERGLKKYRKELEALNGQD